MRVTACLDCLAEDVFGLESEYRLAERCDRLYSGFRADDGMEEDSMKDV